MIGQGPSIVSAKVFHGRRGRVNNSFCYHTGFVLLSVDDEDDRQFSLLSKNRFNLWSLRNRDYGDGSASLKQRSLFLRDKIGSPELSLRALLLTQPACLGYNFNPVSFWIFLDENSHVRAVVSEVNNTSGDRHCYLAAQDDLRRISPGDRIGVRKAFHVSPFQPVDGEYLFGFNIEPERLSISISYNSPSDDGLETSLSGDIQPLTDSRLLSAFLKFPFGAARVSALIIWQALKLKLKGARFRVRPQPPAEDFTS